MKDKIIKGKTLKQWKDKYGDKKGLRIVSSAEAKKDDGKVLKNKKWWLIDGKYYQVPQKKWLIPIFAILGAGAITTGVVTPIMCVKNCNPVTYSKLKLTLNFDTNKVTHLGVIKTTDIKVDGCKEDGTLVKENLVWNTDYVLKINDTEVSTFGTTGYKFENADNTKLTVSPKTDSKITDASCNFTVKYTTTSYDGGAGEEVETKKDFEETDSKKEIVFASKTSGKYANDVTSVKKGNQTLTSSQYTINKSGDGTITIALTDGAMAYLGDLVVTPSTDDKTIVLTETTLTLGSTDTSRIHATTTPSAEKITWSSSDTDVVTVDDEGYVQAKTVTEEKTATITASIDGASATCGITVQPTAKTNYLKLETTADAQLTWDKTSTVESDSFSYCVEDPTVSSNWQKSTVDITTKPIEFSSSKPLYFKGTLTTGKQFGTIKIETKTAGAEPCVTLSGNLMNLMQDTNGNPITDLTGYGSAFQGLFGGSTGLKAISQDGSRFLPCTTLAASCYAGMFSGCTGLESVPTNLLPATTLQSQCYANMFNGCTNLKNVPNLPATTLAANCYLSMFNKCIGLETLPTDLLQAQTTVASCYSSMFEGCTGLTNVPKLPSKTLKASCYASMFNGCIGLTSLPSDLLPATTLAGTCYASMFNGCTGLTSLPSGLLPATDLSSGGGCYNSMFSGCTSLKSVASDLLPATTLAGGKTGCYQAMFSGCSSLENVPALPAGTLQNLCYKEMFKGCSQLKTIPTDLLHSATLNSNCYYSMFENCTSLQNVPTLLGGIDANNCYNSMFKGCTNLKISEGDPSKTSQGQIFTIERIGYTTGITDMFTGTSGSFTTGTPEINKTYYWYTE